MQHKTNKALSAYIPQRADYNEGSEKVPMRHLSSLAQKLFSEPESSSGEERPQSETVFYGFYIMAWRH